MNEKVTTAPAAENKMPWRTERIILDENTVDSLLSINTKNRPLSKPVLAMRMHEMQAGMFVWDSPQSGSYMINESRTWLMDGQHRLTAIKRLGMFGHYAELHIVPDDKAEEVFENLDRGKKRAASDVFAAHGIKNTTKIASIIRFALRFLHEDDSSQSVASFGLSHPDLGMAIRPSAKYHATLEAIPSPFLAAVLVYACRNHVPVVEARNRFELALNNSAEPNSPMRSLSDLIVRILAKGFVRSSLEDGKKKPKNITNNVMAQVVNLLEFDRRGVKGFKLVKDAGDAQTETFRSGPPLSTVRLFP